MTDRTALNEIALNETVLDQPASNESVLDESVLDDGALTEAAPRDAAGGGDARIGQLREWLEQRYPEADLDEDSDLTDGVVEDSLAFVELLVLVEDLRGAPIPAAEVDLENFRTLRIIAARFFETVPGAGDGR